MKPEEIIKKETVKCPITILNKLEESVKKDTWVNPEAQKSVAAGVRLAKEKLQREGFIELTEDELGVKPLQLELPVAYESLRSI